MFRSAPETTLNDSTVALQTEESLFLRALKRQPVERTPVWLMRQAGRYLPEYRELRAKAKDFIALCKNPELACEITLMPLRRYDLDAAIIFSDILLIGQTMGLPLQFVEGEGPVFSPCIENHKQVEQLDIEAGVDKLSFVGDAIRLVTRELGATPLIGFCGSPWTVATYMVEGGSSKDFRKIKTMAWAAPDTLTLLLDKLTQTSIVYLKTQVQAGAKALMIFDTWGGILSNHAYQQFSLSYVQKIVKALKADPITQHTPIIFFAKGKHTIFPALVDLGVDALSIDWSIDLAWARAQTKGQVALQGNLDPTLLLGSPETLKIEIKRVLDSFGDGNGYIFNLGHGVLPQTPPDQVQRLVEWIRLYSEK